MARNKEDAAGLFGHVGSCDIPPQTANSLFDFMFALSFPVEFFAYLGDTPAHDTYDQSPERQIEVMEYVFQSLRTRRNTTGAVYPVLGNHDTFPCDHYDPHSRLHQWLLNNVTRLWHPWLLNSSLTTLKTKGAYSQLHPGTALRIIGLNPFVMLSSNSHLWGGRSDPLDILSWLEEQLDRSEENEESVLILSHESPEISIMNPRKHYTNP